MTIRALSVTPELRWLVGTRAEREAYTPSADDLHVRFLEEDYGMHWRWSGMIWYPMEGGAGAVDPYSGAVVSITEPHAMTHAGKMFSVTKKITGFLTGTTLDLLMITGAGVYPHLTQMKFTTGKGDVDFVGYKDAVVSANGTAMPAIVTNQNIVRVPGMDVYSGPTVTSPGTILHTGWAAPTTAGTGGSAAGILDVSLGEEWVLAPATNYLWRLTNNSGDTISIALDMLWYEL